MSWLQLIFATTPDDTILLSDSLSEAGALAVTFRDGADKPLLQRSTEAMGLWSQTQVIGLFTAETHPEIIIQQLEQALGHRPVYHVETLEDEDWARSWMDRFRPMKFGDRLWVCPSWHTPPEPDAATIMMDPGLAFGTGTHASTALCLQWLATHPPVAQCVVDFGCGSGILAIAALKLGAREVIAIDNDPQAQEVTLTNARVNGVADRVRIISPEDMPNQAVADTLLANILAQPLMTLAPQITRLIQAGGQLVLAGMLCEQTTDVRTYYEPTFALHTQSRAEWAMLYGLKQEAGK